jgi:hypothetical protein
MGIKTRAWDETVPAGSEDRRQGDNRIREGKTDMRERVGEEHDFEAASGTGAETGAHKQGSARAYHRTGVETDPDGSTDPEFESNTSLGRLLVRRNMTDTTKNGTLVGDGAAAFQDLPIGVGSLLASSQFGWPVRHFQIFTSSNPDDTDYYKWLSDPETHLFKIDGANTSISYTSKGTNNKLIVLGFWNTLVSHIAGGRTTRGGFRADTVWAMDSVNAQWSTAPFGNTTIWQGHYMAVFDTTGSAMDIDFAIEHIGAVGDDYAVTHFDNGTVGVLDPPTGNGRPRYTLLIEVGEN